MSGAHVPLWGCRRDTTRTRRVIELFMAAPTYQFCRSSADEPLKLLILDEATSSIDPTRNWLSRNAWRICWKTDGDNHRASDFPRSDCATKFWWLTIGWCYDRLIKRQYYVTAQYHNVVAAKPLAKAWLQPLRLFYSNPQSDTHSGRVPMNLYLMRIHSELITKSWWCFGPTWFYRARLLEKPHWKKPWPSNFS